MGDRVHGKVILHVQELVWIEGSAWWRAGYMVRLSYMFRNWCGLRIPDELRILVLEKYYMG